VLLKPSLDEDTPLWLSLGAVYTFFH
jgi:hypothetical protein